MSELADLLGSLGVDTSMLAVGGDTTEWVDTMPNTDTVVTTRTVRGKIKEGGKGGRGAEWGPVGEEPDLTARDVYLAYRDASPEDQRALRERMFTSRMYSAGVDADEIDDFKNVKSALVRTADWAAFNGVDPWGDGGLPTVEMPEVVPTVGRKMSLAQIQESADTAAGAVLGRRATAEERRLAVSIIRQFEADKQTPSGADLRSAFREGSPREATSRGMEQTMQLFQRIIGGR